MKEKEKNKQVKLVRLKLTSGTLISLKAVSYCFLYLRTKIINGFVFTFMATEDTSNDYEGDYLTNKTTFLNHICLPATLEASFVVPQYFITVRTS